MNLLFWLALTALASPTEPGRAVDDASIEASDASEQAGTTAADIRQVYERVPRFETITLTLDGSVVRLQGSVDSVRTREEATSLAASIDGVRFVDEQLEVLTAPSPTRPSRTTDAELEARLRGVLSEIEALSGVQTRVSNGVVQLSGTVPDNGHRDELIELAEETEGVVFVDATELAVQTSLRQRLAPAAEEGWDLITGIVARLPLLTVGLVIVAFMVFAGRWAASRIAGWRRISDRPLVRATVARIVRLVLVLIGILLALELVDATGLVSALLGTAGVVGLALGFAFQDVVENYLAGVLLALQQPFGKDDVIEVDGITGVVVRLTTRNTLLMSVDGNHVFLPNASVFKSRLTNYSRNPHRRFDFAVGVGVAEHLPDVFRVGVDTLRAMPGVADEPAPSIRIEELGDSSVVVRIYGWVDQRTHDFLAVRTEAIRRIKEAYDHAGFDLPEPIYRVMMTEPTQPKTATDTPSSGQTVVQLEPDRDLEEQVEQERRREPDADLLDETPSRHGASIAHP